jgi:CheY-like chemotaxis protein
MNSSMETIAVRTLLVSTDIQAIELLCHVAEGMAIHVEPCCDAQSALRKLCRVKFEGVIVDLAFEGALALLHKLRGLTSNKSAVSYAILAQRHDQTDAFRAGANFVFDRPLVAGSVARVFKVSYSLMVREKRRYFRCPLSVPLKVTRNGFTFMSDSVNVSESGMCLQSGHSLAVADKLILNFHLPANSHAIEVSAEVCWTKPDGRAGVRFANVQSEIAQALRNWIAERLEESMSTPIELSRPASNESAAVKASLT